MGGAFNATTNNLSFSFFGGLDEPRLYNRALTTNEIITMMWTQGVHHGRSQYDANNLAQWSNTVYVGTFEYDSPADTSFARTNHGTKGASGAAPAHVTLGLTNSYYSFDGGDLITNIVPAGVNSYSAWVFTNSAWYNHADLQGTQYVNGVAASWNNTFYTNNGVVVVLGRGFTGGLDDVRNYTNWSRVNYTNYYHSTTGTYR